MPLDYETTDVSKASTLPSIAEENYVLLSDVLGRRKLGKEKKLRKGEEKPFQRKRTALYYDEAKLRAMRRYLQYVH